MKKHDGNQNNAEYDENENDEMTKIQNLHKNEALRYLCTEEHDKHFFFGKNENEK